MPESQDSQLEVEFGLIRMTDDWYCARKSRTTRAEHFKKACQLLWPHIDWHRWTELCNHEIRRPNAKVTVLMGSGCVAGCTRILNPLTGDQPTIKELYEAQVAPLVMTLNGPARAGIPFIKGVEDLYEVTLSDGNKFTVTAQHRLLTSKGFFRVLDLSLGDLAFSYSFQSEHSHPASTLERVPLARGQGVLCSPKKAEGFQANCSAYSCLCGEQLLHAREAALSSSPSQADVPECKDVVPCWGGLDNELKHTRPCQSAGPPSKHSVSPFEQRLEMFSLLRSYEEISPHAVHSSQSGAQSHSGLLHHSPFSIQVPDYVGTWKSCSSDDQLQTIPSFAIKVSVSRVVSISKTHRSVFYDISVPGEEHYFAEGAIHHNSTGKTCVAGWEFLLEYYASPDDTLVLVSSTDIRGLEARVWGEIKMLHEKATQRFPWLPGYLIDSKHCITTDELGEDEYEERTKTRDLRKGVMCFVSGTLVDTPSGRIEIEKIKTGDKVVNALGVGIVKHTFSRTAEKIVRIRISDGRIIECTPEHPVMTARGWINAVDLTKFDMVLSAYETMQIMRFGNSEHRWSSGGILQQGLSRASASKEMRFLRECIQAEKTNAQIYDRPFLLDSVCRKMGCGEGFRIEQQPNSKMRQMREIDGECSLKQNVLLQGLPERLEADALSSMWQKVHFYSGNFYKTKDEVLFKILQMESDCGNECPKKNHAYKRRTSCLGHVSSFYFTFSFTNWIKNIRRKISLVSNRFGISSHQVSGRDRWWGSQHSIQDVVGQKKNSDSEFSRVESVEVLEPSGDPRFKESAGGYTVHNLEVGGHPSYSVNGVIVHNCIPTVQGGRNVGLGKWVGIKQKHLRLVADDCPAMNSTFLSAFANLNNNEDFQAAVLGNPDDTLDPLGVAAEPKEGWSSHLEPTKTEVWDTIFFSGRCVNLVGLDSPNFDFPQDQPARYPYLISAQKIAETITAFKKDSFEYYSQCVGVMKISQMSRRVITRDLCRQFHATDDAVWNGEPRTLIAGLDAAYGGDRCVGGYIEFGKCTDNKIRIQFHPPHIVPMRVNPGEPMAEEDAISEYEKDFCQSRNIPPENFFHDSTGRGSLGTSLSRKWSPNCNPIEFGGSPTKRPVTLDTYIIDKKTNLRRLKRCDEHYSKFVTELWYSLRYAIEADQVRGLPEDVINELSLRNWETVANDKKEVESKLDMKERTRKSPDLGDWAAICLEGARRRGFQIAKLTNEEYEGSTAYTWLSDLATKRFRWHKSKQLATR